MLEYSFVCDGRYVVWTDLWAWETSEFVREREIREIDRERGASYLQPDVRDVCLTCFITKEVPQQCFAYFVHTGQDFARFFLSN